MVGASVAGCVSSATFTRPDLTTFVRLDGLGLQVTGQVFEPDRALLACLVLAPDDWCRRCGCQGSLRDTVIGRLSHEPFRWHRTTLLSRLTATSAPSALTCTNPARASRPW